MHSHTLFCGITIIIGIIVVRRPTITPQCRNGCMIQWYCLLALDAKAELEREMAADTLMPAVKHHESRECVGMFEYRKDEEQLLVDNLITGQ